eukprot:1176719-Prorocentrum_minimum.AAC.1
MVEVVLEWLVVMIASCGMMKGEAAYRSCNASHPNSSQTIDLCGLVRKPIVLAQEDPVLNSFLILLLILLVPSYTLICIGVGCRESSSASARRGGSAVEEEGGMAVAAAATAVVVGATAAVATVTVAGATTATAAIRRVTKSAVAAPRDARACRFQLGEFRMLFRGSSSGARSCERVTI